MIIYYWRDFHQRRFSSGNFTYGFSYVKSRSYMIRAPRKLAANSRYKSPNIKRLISASASERWCGYYTYRVMNGVIHWTAHSRSNLTAISQEPASAETDAHEWHTWWWWQNIYSREPLNGATGKHRGASPFTGCSVVWCRGSPIQHTLVHQCIYHIWETLLGNRHRRRKL